MSALYPPRGACGCYRCDRRDELDFWNVVLDAWGDSAPNVGWCGLPQGIYDQEANQSDGESMSEAEYEKRYMEHVKETDAALSWVHYFHAQGYDVTKYAVPGCDSGDCRLIRDIHNFGGREEE